MKKFILFAVSIFAFTQVFAQSNIAYINTETIAENSDYVAKARTLLEAEYREKAEEVKVLEDEIRQMRDNFEARKLTYTEAAKQDAQEAINRKLNDYKILVESSQSTLSKRQNELLEPILEKIKEVAIKKGYSAVFDISSGKILYVDPKLDKTQTMLEELNKE